MKTTLALVPLLVVLAAILWRDDVDSFGTTWRAAAAGVESSSSFGAITVWDGDRETIAPAPAAPLLLARVAGARLAGTSALVWLAVLAWSWAEGVRRIARSGGASPKEALVAALGASGVALALADGRIEVLGAGPLVCALAASFERRAFVAAAAVTALAFTSRAGLLLAAPLFALVALVDVEASSGRLRWLPAVAATVLLLLAPEPAWTRLLDGPARAFFGVGAYALPRRSAYELAAIAMLAPFAVFAATRRSWPLAAVLGIFTLAGLGGEGRVVGRLDSPARFATLLLPSLRLHAFPDLALVVGAATALAIFARNVPLTLGIAAVATIAASVGGHAAASAVEPPAALVAAASSGRGRLLVVPPSIAVDRAWREAMPTSRMLQNGREKFLAANAPVLARELERGDARAVHTILRRLGITRAIVPARIAEELGQVIATDGAMRLVELATMPPSLARCLSARASGTVGDRNVSVPERALDGDPRTRWGSGGAQRAGTFFELDFGGLRRLDVVELDASRFRQDLPRGFRITADAEDGWRTIVEEDPYVGELTWLDQFAIVEPNRDGVIRRGLGGVDARRLRLELTRGGARYDWSIGEICVRGYSSQTPKTSSDGSPKLEKP